MTEKKKKEGEALKHVITSVQIESDNEGVGLNVSLGFEKNGAMVLNFQDPAEMNQDNNYINKDAFPNSGIMTHGKYSMWLSMFTRHVKTCDNEKINLGEEKSKN